MSEGKKYDAGKDRWDLLPVKQVEEIVKVLTFGSVQYGDENWKLVANGYDRYYAAALRHITTWRKGQKLDHGTGLHHLSHAATCLIFLMYLDEVKE